MATLRSPSTAMPPPSSTTRISCAFARSGFRGEALPSIGAVAKLGITTRHASEPHAWSLSVEGGVKSQIMPAALSQGTRVEVSDLFYATPARLKFLKTDRTEAEAIREVVRRLAMARPDIAFTLAGEERAPVTWAAALPGAAGRLTRLGDILGSDFRSSAIEVRAEREGVVVEGFAAAPSLTRANALGQYLFVNGRPVRDKLILGAVRAAYSDYLPRDRHPVVALFVTLEPQEVDANVHPAKTEVRFRNAGLVRALIVHALKDGLAREGRRTAANTDGAALSAFRPVLCAAPDQLGLAEFAGLSGQPRTFVWRCGGICVRRSGPGRLRCRHADRRRALRGAALRRPARPPARRGADADPRDLHRVADPRRTDRGGPARRP